MVSNGHALLRQACDICAIAMSLVAYVIYNLVNICLIGTQNISLVLALWDAVRGPLWRMTDVVAAFLVHISSSAVAMAILLWILCQLALELLASAVCLLASCVVFHLTGLVLLAGVLAVILIVLYPEQTLRLATQFLSQHHARPSYHRLWEDIVQLSRLPLGLEAWSRVWSRSLQLAAGQIGEEHQEPPKVAPGGCSQPGSSHRTLFLKQKRRLSEQHQLEAKSNSTRMSLQLGKKPWKLLKEQEEWKKCVICQEQSKMVLLLPCRHLCLCQACTEILMRHPAYHRKCPLCCCSILQTLNVYL